MYYENANHLIHFSDVRLHICMWCPVGATLLSYVGYAQVKIIKHLLTYLLFMVQTAIKI